MDDSLRSIIYVSTAKMPLDGPSLESLLVDSRDHNVSTRTTGVLLLAGGTFMQCFEGSGDGFDETWDRIRLSRRHKELTVLLDDGIAARSFPDWQMGYFGPTDSALLAQSTTRWKLDSLVRQPNDSVSLDLLQNFWLHAR